MGMQFLVYFLVLQIVFIGGVILVLRHVFISSVEGAKQRLEKDAESARAREAELNRKIRQADDELAQRKKELDALEQKMKNELEADAQKHKEELVNKARSEAEEIIAKAQAASEGIRRNVEKEMDLRMVDYSIKIMNEVFTQKARTGLEKDLVEEFIAQLKNVDMSKISLDIKSADIVTAQGISDAELQKFSTTIRERIGRDIQIQQRKDPSYISGVVIQFGSLHLDGSIKTALKEAAIAMKVEIEKSYLKKAQG